MGTQTFRPKFFEILRRTLCFTHGFGNFGHPAGEGRLTNVGETRNVFARTDGGGHLKIAVLETRGQFSL